MLIFACGFMYRFFCPYVIYKQTSKHGHVFLPISRFSLFQGTFGLKDLCLGSVQFDLSQMVQDVSTHYFYPAVLKWICQVLCGAVV